MPNAMQKIQDKFRVRIIKSEADTRLTIAGEHFINPGTPEHDGTEHDGVPVAYAVVPAHHADHLAANNKQYIFSDPFIPEDVKTGPQLQCTKCEFVAKSENGLRAHMQAHND